MAISCDRAASGEENIEPTRSNSEASIFSPVAWAGRAPVILGQPIGEATGTGSARPGTMSYLDVRLKKGGEVALPSAGHHTVCLCCHCTQEKLANAGETVDQANSRWFFEESNRPAARVSWLWNQAGFVLRARPSSKSPALAASGNLLRAYNQRALRTRRKQESIIAKALRAEGRLLYWTTRP